tara:strand:- start:1231 stop:2154 length:924 start_codon:yes stop_codon:yes gene_type:complete
VSEIEFVRDLAFEYGIADQVTPMIRRVVAQNPSPFTFYGTGTYIIGHGEVAVIDPGPLIDTHIDALLNAVAGEQVTHILITHTHKDHSPAAAPFKAATGAPTYGFGPHMPGNYWKNIGYSGPLSGDLDFAPDYSLKDGDVIYGDGWSIETIHTPGHIANHLCFGLKEENCLFSGDQVMGWSTTVVAPPEGDMFDYMRSCERLLDRHEEIFWPTHGPPILTPHEYLQALVKHRLNRENEIFQMLSNGVIRISEIVSVLYKHSPTHLHGAAAKTILSHLVNMIQTGRVMCEGRPTLKSKFRVSETTVKK